MIPVGLELALVGVEEAKAGQGVLLEVLAVLVAGVVEVEVEDRGAGARRMGIALEKLGTGGKVANLEHHSPGRGAKFHAPTKRPLGVPRMDGEAQSSERWLLGWGRKSS